jgi:hypothetical protein
MLQPPEHLDNVRSGKSLTTSRFSLQIGVTFAFARQRFWPEIQALRQLRVLKRVLKSSRMINTRAFLVPDRHFHACTH